jgi:hypothetical protein
MTPDIKNEYVHVCEIDDLSGSLASEIVDAFAAAFARVPEEYREWARVVTFGSTYAIEWQRPMTEAEKEVERSIDRAQYERLKRKFET